MSSGVPATKYGTDALPFSGIGVRLIEGVRSSSAALTIPDHTMSRAVMYTMSDAATATPACQDNDSGGGRIQ
jgi:hypothetical protein